jgi:four helix bundle protein
MKGDDIAKRLLCVAVEVVGLLRGFEKGVVGNHVGRQLIRAATGGGANDEEARGAESRADFVHKASIACKELRETLYWLKVVNQSGLNAHPNLPALIREADELVAILTFAPRSEPPRDSLEE